MASLQADLRMEVTCPICRELLTEPLSLGCGHSFCQACIAAKNGESLIISPGGEKSCPVCHTSYQPGNLQPNPHLANIVKKVREAELSPQKMQRSNLCVHHGEKLLLFCKTDAMIICWACARSQEHSGHQIILAEKVFKDCQDKLQETLTRLRKEQKEAETLEAQITEERASWKHQTQAERQRIESSFNKLHDILDNDKKRELHKLEKEEVNVLDNLADAKYQLDQQYQDLSQLIADVEYQMQGSSVVMLEDMFDFIKRIESWTLKKPTVVSKKLQTMFRVPDLEGILQVFRELRDVQCYWVDVTMNPVHTSSNLVISADHRQVAAVPMANLRNSYQHSTFGVRSCQYFSSGKHYWEVDVSRKTAWILGIYCGSSDFNKSWGSWSTNGSDVNQDVYCRHKPKDGYWVIGLRNQSEYNAFADSPSSHSEVLTLFVAVPPNRVGVFLDYEAGSVSFFNVTNHGSLIYKFSQCCFSQDVYSYFHPCNCPAPMTLCTSSS